MATDVCNLARCFNRTVGLLNASDDDDPYNSTIAEFGEWTAQEIKDALAEGDVLFVDAIISNPTHPYRNFFISGSAPADYAAGAMVPEHMGAHDLVEIRIDGSNWVKGRQVRNVTRYNAIAASTTISDTVRKAYYCYENGRIFTAGQRFRVYVPVYNPIRGGSPALQAPIQYERGLIAWAVAGLYKGTTEEALHEFYSKQAAMMLQLASGGQTTMPDIEKFRRGEG